MCAKIGTCAGMTLAGLVAATSLSKATRRIQVRLVAAGVTANFDTTDAKHVFDPQGTTMWPDSVPIGKFCVVDDDVFVSLVAAKDAYSTASFIAGVVFEEYSRAGLQLHLKPAKTAVLVSWHGEGQTDARVDYYQAVYIDVGVRFEANGQHLALPSCSKYKHVGCWARADNKYCTDISVKAASIRTATASLKKHVLPNGGIDKKTRVEVVHTHVLPCGEYSSGG